MMSNPALHDDACTLCPQLHRLLLQHPEKEFLCPLAHFVHSAPDDGGGIRVDLVGGRLPSSIGGAAEVGADESSDERSSSARRQLPGFSSAVGSLFMPDERELGREAEEEPLAAVLQDVVLDSEDVKDFLTGLTEVAAAAFSGAHGEVFCGVTLLRPHSKVTVASSSERARQMDEVQYGFDDGPCLRAAREDYTVHIRDFLTETEFPEYRHAIASYGVRSALGVPVRLDEGASAGLDFYSTEPDAFDEKGILVAERIARDASRSLRLAVRIAKLTDTTRNLEAAMSSRTMIDLAAGAIMAQNRCSHERAMDILRSASSTRNIKLRDLAASILASVGQPAPVNTHFDY
ncbi:ANTAR domain-containing protein [Arthrobacter sp. MDB2-24]